MKIHTNFQQNSLEWLQIRAGKLTASECGDLVTPMFKIRTGETPNTLLHTKLAEAWRGMPVDTFGSKTTEYGHVKEEQALPWYAFEFNEEVEKVGFIETDDGLCGCSPDGIISRELGLEVKCLAPQNHLKILLAGAMPDDYAAQVHFSMFVTGWPAWRFLSYCPGFPAFVTTIERDEKIQSVIKEATAAFLDKLGKAKTKLTELNGGKWPEPVKFQPSSNEPIRFTWEQNDITP